MNTDNVKQFLEGQKEIDAIREGTFECPDCGNQVPGESDYCVSCQKEVTPKSEQ